MTHAWSGWEGHVVNGGFHLKKYLGGSQQSAVFLTEDRGAQSQPVAIKLIATPPGDANLQLSRWGLARGFTHPHLIRLLRTGSCRLGENELVFVAMEYAEENLAQILLERPLTPQEARELLEPTLDTLAYLHSQGFIHGHLKPANILAIEDRLKLASDNIGRIDEAHTSTEEPDHYGPPEATRSPAADVWALGMTMAEVLTQRLPSWSGQNGDATDPVLPEDLPAPFLEIVRGCLRRDPRHRLTIAGISARLFSGSVPTPARAPDVKPSPQDSVRPVSPVVRSQQTSSIRRIVFPVVIVAAALVVALLAGLGRPRPQPQTQSEVAAVKPEEKPQAPEIVKPSPITPANKTRSQSDPPSGSTGNRLDPAVPQSDAPAPGNAVQQVLPDVPQTASDTIQGTLRVGVRVKVDAAGNVMAADLDSPGPSKYFARLSLEAAQRWKFAPSAQGPGREFVLHFEFKNSGTRAYATRAGG